MKAAQKILHKITNNSTKYSTNLRNNTTIKPEKQKNTPINIGKVSVFSLPLAKKSMSGRTSLKNSTSKGPLKRQRLYRKAQKSQDLDKKSKI